VIGARTTLSRLVPTKGHTEHAHRSGTDVAQTIAALDRQLADCEQLLRHLLDDITAVSTTDPNIATISAIITSLS
jgi:hypothetical protein